MKEFIISVIMILMLAVLAYGLIHWNKPSQESLCIEICRSEKTYSVGYQMINDLENKGEQLCVCYYPTMEGNKIIVHNIN